jgi:toxin ParE1/3/4
MVCEACDSRRKPLRPEVDALVLRIAANPQQFPPVLRDVRRARLRHFPYGLFFRVDDGTIYVVACFHGSRDPRQWQDRA